MKALGLLLVLGLFSSVAAAAPTLTFDNPTVDGGTVTYDGAGGALVASDVIFQQVIGVETPNHAGVSLFCYPVNCLLDFITGPNLTEGPPIYRFTGGGALTLTGGLNTQADGLGVQIAPGGTLLAYAGTFDPPVGVLTGGVENLLVLAVGSDLKDLRLTDFYGITGVPLDFATTALSLGGASFEANGGFTALVHDADFANTAVPEPATLLLLGTGLVGGAVARRFFDGRRGKSGRERPDFRAGTASGAGAQR